MAAIRTSLTAEAPHRRSVDQRQRDTSGRLHLIHINMDKKQVSGHNLKTRPTIRASDNSYTINTLRRHVAFKTDQNWLGDTSPAGLVLTIFPFFGFR